MRRLSQLTVPELWMTGPNRGSRKGFKEMEGLRGNVEENCICIDFFLFPRIPGTSHSSKWFQSSPDQRPYVKRERTDGKHARVKVNPDCISFKRDGRGGKKGRKVDLSPQ